MKRSIYNFIYAPGCLADSLGAFAKEVARLSKGQLTQLEAHVLLIEAAFYQSIEKEFLVLCYRAVDYLWRYRSEAEAIRWKGNFAAAVGQTFVSAGALASGSAILPEGMLEVRYIHRNFRPKKDRQELLMFARKPGTIASYMISYDPVCQYGEDWMITACSEKVKLYFRLLRPLIINAKDRLYVNTDGTFILAHRKEDRTFVLQEVDLPPDILFAANEKPAAWFKSSSSEDFAPPTPQERVLILHPKAPRLNEA